MPRFPVPGDEVTGCLEVGVEDANRGNDAILDVVEKTEAEPVEVDVGISPVRTFFAKTEGASASVKREIQNSDPTSPRIESTLGDPGSVW